MKSNQRKYLIFSKSRWGEAPRLRHQVARLLVSNGDLVYFFEKPIGFFDLSRYASKSEADDGRVRLLRTRELIHPQLRVLPFLRWLNALFERWMIKRLLDIDGGCQDVRIINFNYDYFFLRKIFPENKILTVINDDFVAQARLLKGAHVRSVLELTSRVSDAVFVVSYPLLNQLRDWCSPVIFFPWADLQYTKIDKTAIKNSVLIWAHIDRRIDFELLTQVATRRSELNFDIVGPVAKGVESSLSALCARCGNVNALPSSELDALDVSKYFCAAIPYKKGCADIEAVSMSNKTLQLLARGLPIATYGMPNFFEHIAIRKADDVDEFIRSLDFFAAQLISLQDSIRDLVSSNQSGNRVRQIESVFDDCGSL